MHPTKIAILAYLSDRALGMQATRDEISKGTGLRLDTHPGQLRRAGLIEGEGTEADEYFITQAGHAALAKVRALESSVPPMGTAPVPVPVTAEAGEPTLEGAGTSVQTLIHLRPQDLKPYAKNARNNATAIAAVAASIERFGFRQPILVDRDRVIIAGHTRHAAALRLGLERVPVLIAADLTPNQCDALRIADNRTSELATWDDALLSEEIRRLSDTTWEALGFGADELARLTGEAMCAAQDAMAQIEKPSAEEPTPPSPGSCQLGTPGVLPVAQIEKPPEEIEKPEAPAPNKPSAAALLAQCEASEPYATAPAPLPTCPHCGQPLPTKDAP